MGVIYILTNPSFPDYVKIGYADDVEKRIADLNHSECIPFGFRLYAYYEVEQRLTDLKVHALIDSLNPTLRSRDKINGKQRKREFFQITKEAAYIILETVAYLSGTMSRLHLKEQEQQIMSKEEAEVIDKTSYSIDSFLSNKNENVKKMYYTFVELVKTKLPKAICEATPNYIALRNEKRKNICEIHLQKNRLMFNTRAPINDESLNIGNKLPPVYNWSLNYRVYINKEDELAKAVDLIVNVANQIKK